MTNSKPSSSAVELLQEKVSSDLSKCLASSMAYVGDKLGLFRKMAEIGKPVTPAVLASQLNLHERYVEEWLKAVCAAEYIEYNPADHTFYMTDAQTQVFTADGTKECIAAYLPLAVGSVFTLPEVVESGFKAGKGVSFSQLHPDVIPAIGRAHVYKFTVELPQKWLPALDGVHEKLAKGGKILDVGCGEGISTRAIAGTYPAAAVVGLDMDSSSIHKANAKLRESGLINVEFVCLPMEDYHPPEAFDFAFIYNCIHDMKDPVGALRTIRGLMKAGGCVLWGEPKGSVNPLENRSVMGCFRAGMSVAHCLTVSLAEGGAGLGTMMGIDMARQIATEGGFAHFEVLQRPPYSETETHFFLLRP